MISQVPLVFAFATATHLIRLCNRTPNIPQTKHDRDTLFFLPVIRTYALYFIEWAFVLPCVHHIVITALLDRLEASPICPQPQQLNHRYFTWSSYTVISLSLIFVSAILRLLAFQTLGKNFSFELAKPDQLVTTGIYSYVQHPSYPPLMVLLCSSFWLFLPLDGVPACFLPWSIVEVWVTWKWPLLALTAAIIAMVVRVRVGDEEAMLKETFGKQWIEWHRKTPRFVPFLF